MTPGRKRTNDSANAAATSSSAAATNEDTKSSHFLCSVCRENLSLPASIDDTSALGLENNNGEAKPAQRAARGKVRQVAKARNMIVGSSSTHNHNASVTDLVATLCGHVFHRVCLDRCFEGRRAQRLCPLCRKKVPKPIRLFPSMSPDSINTGNEAASLGNTTINWPSTPAGFFGEGAAGPSRSTQCPRPDSNDLGSNHKTVFKDSNELREQNNRLRESIEMREADIINLQDHQIRHRNEVEQPQRQLEEQPSPRPRRRRDQPPYLSVYAVR